MNREFKEHIEAEIPILKRYFALIRPVMLLKVRRNNFSYDAIYMFRYCLFFLKSTNFLKKQMAKRYRRLLAYRYGILFSVTSKTKFGKGLRFPHPTGIVIGADVNVGENCIIYQNVTIGGARVGEGAQSKYPTIGNNCILYAGSKILGEISISDGTTVGANAVLLRDTEPDSTYAGIPAKKIN